MSDGRGLVRRTDDTEQAESIDVLAMVRGAVGEHPQIELEYEGNFRLLWITMRPEPKPVITFTMIQSIRKVQHAVRDLWGTGADRPILFMACRARGSVYSLGGDLDLYLDCLAHNERDMLAAYAEAACDVMSMSRSGLGGAVITLSNVHARVMGGGIDSARGCNVMIAEEGASFCYPEVNFNHFPIAAVPILSRHVGPCEAERILLSGRDYGADEFLAKGALDAVAPRGKGDEWIRRYAANAIASHSSRTAIIATFNRMAGNLADDLAAGSAAWVSHIMTLKPLEISKLQRITAAQERMLGRLMRQGEA